MTSTRARQIFCGRLDVGNSSGSARPVAPPPFRVPLGWRLCAKSFRIPLFARSPNNDLGSPKMPVSAADVETSKSNKTGTPNEYKR